MALPQVLDVRSAARIGLPQALAGFEWPVAQGAYDAVAMDFLRGMENLYQARGLDEAAKTLLVLKAVDLSNEFNFFAACLVDVQAFKSRGADAAADESCFLYKMIQADAFEARYSFQEHIARYYGRLRKDSLRERVSGFFYDAYLRAQAWVPSEKSYFALRTPLLGQNKRGDWRSLDRFLRPFRARTSSPPPRSAPAKMLTEALADLARSCLAARGHAAGEKALGYVRDLIAFHIGMADEDVGRRFGSHIRFESAAFFCGTGGNYACRLLSHVFQREGRPVVRFDHGGDRGLFEDPLWGVTELSLADRYVAHAKQEAARIRERVENASVPLLLDRRPAVMGCGSLYHRNLHGRFQNRPAVGRARRVLVASGAMQGQNRVLPHMKWHDLVYLDWQARLLKVLTASGLHTVAKRHPKGLLAEVPLLAPFCSEEILGAPLGPFLESCDAFVFDLAGSAFIEALCTMKPVVLIDVPLRPFNPRALRDLEGVCRIVRASYDEGNRIVVGRDALLEAVHAPVNAERRNEFLQGYLFEGEGSILN